MIKLVNVKKSFNRRKANEIKAIDNTSVELPDTGLITFLGNSGCGKTTLLNAIGGLDKVDKGDIYIDGKRMTRRRSGARDELRNINIGYIFQNYNLIEDATVFDNVATALRMIGVTSKDDIEKRVMYILDRVGIARYRNRPAKMLSGGERQRVGIARAIVKNPRIIIADEPTGNLDSSNTIEVMNIIKAISREKLVILVTHERNIAEFYADRIIEIVDGRITDDRLNSHEGSLDYRMDTKIYLGDMPYAVDLSQKGFDVKLYSDKETAPPPIKIVIRNNNLYIDTGDMLDIGDEGISIIDGKYEGLTQDIFEGYEFDYEAIYGETRAPKYKSIYGPVKSLTGGFKRIARYSKIKRILLLGFILASMFVIYAVSNVAGVTHITDDSFITTHKNYLTANVGRVSLTGFNAFDNLNGIDYAIPGDGTVSFAMPIEDYLQSTGMWVMIQGTLADAGYLTEEDLVMGRLPAGDNEIVIDSLIYNRQFTNTWDTRAHEVGIDSPEKLLGRTLKFSPYLPDFTIVGISNTVSPCIYVKKDMIMTLAINDMGNNVGLVMEENRPIQAGSIIAYRHIESDPEKWIISGEAPAEDYEALVSDTYRENMRIGQNIDVKVSGHNLVICGFYHDERGGLGVYVNDNTEFLAALSSKENITLSPIDKNATYMELTGRSLEEEMAENPGILATGVNMIRNLFGRNINLSEEIEEGDEEIELYGPDEYEEEENDGVISVVDAQIIESARITDPYNDARTSYEQYIKQGVFRTIVMAVVIVIISLVEIYLILRASFLSRIKEVGVLRAIGLKKGDIYRMFAGEVVAISLITSLPGMLLMGYILRSLTQINYFSDMFRMNMGVFFISFAIVFIFNLIAGLLPVFLTLRKTPAAILARNDVN